MFEFPNGVDIRFVALIHSFSLGSVGNNWYTMVNLRIWMVAYTYPTRLQLVHSKALDVQRTNGKRALPSEREQVADRERDHHLDKHL